MALGMAFTTAMVSNFQKFRKLKKIRFQANKQHRKISRKAEKITEPITTNKAFSIDSAEKFDRALTLPSRKWFMISDVVTDGDVSNWSTANLVTLVRALARTVFDKVCLVESCVDFIESCVNSKNLRLPLRTPIWCATQLHKTLLHIFPSLGTFSKGLLVSFPHVSPKIYKFFETVGNLILKKPCSSSRVHTRWVRRRTIARPEVSSEEAGHRRYGQ